MRIAYDHQIFGWQQFGGVSRYFYETAARLGQFQGHDVAIFSPLIVNQYVLADRSSVRISGIAAPHIQRFGRIYRVLNSVLTRRLLVKFAPDIVHETYYSPTRVAPRNAKVVLTVFDMIHEKFPRNFSSFDPTTRHKASAVERADHIICISENTRRDLIELFDVDPKKTSVVYLGFSLQKTLNAGAQTLRMERPYILYVGSRAGYKNFDALVHAYGASAQLRNELLLVCFGGGGLTSRERALLKELGIPLENVRQVSGSDAVLEVLYRSARAFVYPSLYEGFGIPPLEAMSFGCPVICSCSSSIPEVVGDAAETFDPRDVGAIGEALKRVAFQDGIRQDLIRKGQQRLKAFSWDKCARQTLEVYKRVLEQ